MALTSQALYGRLFDRYAAAADGKQLVGAALVELLRARGVRTVLDVGAGDG
ncbi:hypothetical protein [Streptomyces sp. NPDC059168]|uniref:hypothetical protein n=1 Tax=Streptomyces sp. NPDC059168 TaxID=3346753 RepID=UPI0036C6D91A